MPVTARLSRRFYETFGDEIANDLVEWFNAVDTTYRQELREQNDLNWGRVEARISQGEGKFEARLGLVEAHLEARIGQTEARFDARLAETESRLRTEMERLRSDMLKWMFLFWAGSALTVLGLRLR